MCTIAEVSWNKSNPLSAVVATWQRQSPMLLVTLHNPVLPERVHRLQYLNNLSSQKHSALG